MSQYLGERPRKLRTPTAIPVSLLPRSSRRRLVACTLDISLGGARLHMPGDALQSGDVLAIQFQRQRALFKVVWVGGDSGARRGQIGVQCMENGRHFWNGKEIDLERDLKPFAD